MRWRDPIFKEVTIEKLIGKTTTSRASKSRNFKFFKFFNCYSTSITNLDSGSSSKVRVNFLYSLLFLIRHFSVASRVRDKTLIGNLFHPKQCSPWQYRFKYWPRNMIRFLLRLPLPLWVFSSSRRVENISSPKAYSGWRAPWPNLKLEA